jgi:hypothetical protein
MMMPISKLQKEAAHLSKEKQQQWTETVATVAVNQTTSLCVWINGDLHSHSPVISSRRISKCQEEGCERCAFPLTIARQK